MKKSSITAILALLICAIIIENLRMILLFIAGSVIIGSGILAIIISGYKKTQYYKVTHTPYFDMRFDAGKYGEYQLYSCLKSFEQQGCQFLFNLYIPKENEKTTEIDVVMISNKGIVVFESKNYSGWIFGTETQTEWTQTFRGRRGNVPKEHFYNPILQNKTHIRCLKHIVGEDVPILSVVAFSDRCELKNINLPHGEAQVVKYECAFDAVSNMLSSCYYTIDDEKTKNLYSMLYPYSQTDEITKAKHIGDLKNNYSTNATHNTLSSEDIKNINNDVNADNNGSKPLNGVQSIYDLSGNSPISNSSNNCQQQQEDQTNITKEDNKHNNEDTNIPITTIEEIKCPQCGGRLVKRVAKKGTNAGREFYGCSNYPKCRYTKAI